MFRSLLITAVLAAAAQAAPLSAVPNAPVWATRPTFAEIQKAYPSKPKTDRQSGRAVLDCRIASDGRLEQCAVESETPADMGFGQAALSLAPSYRSALFTTSGDSPVGADVSIPVTFPYMDPAGPPPLAIPPAPLVSYDDPDWLRHPTAADIKAVYPEAARSSHVTGQTVVDCRIERDGAISLCVLGNEAPVGYGFGKAALALAPQFQAKPLELPLIRSMARIRIPFELP